MPVDSLEDSLDSRGGKELREIMELDLLTKGDVGEPTRRSRCTTTRMHVGITCERLRPTQKPSRRC